MSTGTGASDLLQAEDSGVDEIVAGKAPVAARSPLQLFWRRFRKDKVALAAGIFILLLILVAIFAPLAAKAVQMAVSRQREYLADATSVQFTRNPQGLISALQKLADKAAPFPGVSRATQHLFIVNPVKTFTSKTPALLATHPAIADRIARLRNLGG